MAASRPGTKMVSGRENYLILLAPIGPLHSGMACLHGPPSGDWLQTFHLLGHSIWQAMDMKLGGCEHETPDTVIRCGCKGPGKK